MRADIDDLNMVPVVDGLFKLCALVRGFPSGKRPSSPPSNEFADVNTAVDRVRYKALLFLSINLST